MSLEDACANAVSPTTILLPYFDLLQRTRRPKIGIGLTRKDFHEYQVKVILSTGTPLTFFQKQTVQESYRCLDPDITFLAPTTLRSRVLDYRTDTIDHIKSQISAKVRVAIALDAWSARNRQSYLAIKAFWIDSEWKLHEELLDFPPMLNRHTGEYIASLVNNVISKYGLDGRITSVTADNASNNKTMHQALVRSMKHISTTLPRTSLDYDAPQITITSPEDDVGSSSQAQQDESIDDSGDEDGSDDDTLFVPCLAHIIQLALKDILGSLRIEPSNDDLIKIWDEDNARSEVPRVNGLPLTLFKVCGSNMVVYNGL